MGKDKPFLQGSRMRSHTTTNSQIVNRLQRDYLKGEARSKVHSLGRLAFLYLNEDKKTLAHLIFCELLRLCPYRSELVDYVRDASPMKPPLRSDLPVIPNLVSVVIPTRDRPFELRNAIESVLNQTHADFEIIVVNDAGSNQTKKMVDSFRSQKIRYIELSRQGRPAGARNMGIAKARGEFISYLDDDDVFYPDHLKLLTDFLRTNPETGLAYTNAWWIPGETVGNEFVPSGSRETCRWRPRTFTKDRLLLGNYICTLNIMHRRSILSETGLFNEALPRLEDWEFLLRSVIGRRIRQINKITGEYRWKHTNPPLERMIEIEFWSWIIKNYYVFYRGKIALALHYLQKRSYKRAEEYVHVITSDYPGYYRHLDSLKLLFEIGNALGNKEIIRMATGDYFEFSPRDCLKGIAERRSLEMARSILPKLPARAIKSFWGRARTRFSCLKSRKDTSDPH